MIYLDNAATTPLSDEMKTYLVSVLDVFGNPSSIHSVGKKAKQIIQQTREMVASFIGAQGYECIYFTSSGSASNTLAILGFADANDCGIFYSPTLHKSALKTIEKIQKTHIDTYVHKLKVDKGGTIDEKDLAQQLGTSIKSPLVVVEYANSEIGTIQNVKGISDIVHKNGGMMIVDCTGSISTIPLNVDTLGIDMAIFSAHKLGALKGTGVLYKRKGIILSPLICGSQEDGLFSGTENVLGIASLGKAIELLEYDDKSFSRDFVWSYLKDNIPNVYLVGADMVKNRLLNNLCICVENIKANELVGLIDDLYDTQISTGSACNNGDILPSSTLVAIGVKEKDLNSCIRVTFSGRETIEQLKEFCNNITTCIKILRNNKLD